MSATNPECLMKLTAADNVGPYLADLFFAAP